MFHTQCLPWLTAITGIDLTDVIDMTCSKYEYTGQCAHHWSTIPVHVYIIQLQMWVKGHGVTDMQVGFGTCT